MAEILPPHKVLFDYGCVPTIKRFALDDSRIRCLIGPFGSGKSSGCVIEIMKRAQAQVPGPDGIRRSRWAVVRNCYDDQTEILTEKRGWQLFKDLLLDDAVATLDGDHLVYKTPEGVVSYPYQGEMVGFEGESIDFLVTPEHKMWVSTRRTRKKVWSDYEIRTAEEIYGGELVRVRKDAQWVGKETEYSEDFFEFLGFWFAEGSCGIYERQSGSPSKRLNVTQKKHWEYTEDLLSRNNLLYGKREKKDSGGCFTYDIMRNKILQDIFCTFLNAGTQIVRHIPQWIKDAPVGHLKAFLYGFFVGDGGDSQGTTRLSTSSKIMADDLQEMVLKSGGVANIGMSDCTGMIVNVNGRIGKVNAPSYKVTILKESRHRPILKMNPHHTNHLKGWYKQQYDGMVYCVSLPDIPVYVRRKGNAFWCLRSYGQLKDTTIKTFCDWFPPKIFGEFRVTDHSYIFTKLVQFGIHLEVIFRALDRPDQVSNLLSLEVTGAWFNEVREIPWAIVDAMDSRIGRYPSKRDGGASWYGIIMDTNPPDEDSTLYKKAEKIRPDNFKVFKQPSGLSVHAENVKNLPKNYYQNLAKGKDEMYIRIYIHGQYGYLVSGKPVFLSFRDNVHVAPHPLEPMKGVDVLIGLDFGLQPACVIGQLTPTGQLRILDELVSDGMGIRQFCQNQLLPLLRQKYFGMNVMGFGDPSGTSRAPTDESTCFDILHGSDVGLSSVVDAPTNAILPRVGAVEFFLNKMYAGEPGFVLSPNCHFIRKAMNGAYHYDKDPKGSGDEYKPMPVKNFASHVSDALEYLCLYVTEKTAYDKQRLSFLSQMKRKDYRPASEIAGY